MFGTTAVELCAGSAEDVILGLRFPIDRIELNSALELGGLTPTPASLAKVKSLTDLPVVCMVRPRGGDFCYGEALFHVLLEDARILLDHGADGIVFGFLNPDHTVDVQRTKALTELAHACGKTAVFHRAFDETPDPFAAADILSEIGIDRLLTSGQKASAREGSTLIRQLIRNYHGRLEILPGAGINGSTVQKIVETTGTQWIHLSGGTSFPDGSRRCDPKILEDVFRQMKER